MTYSKIVGTGSYLPEKILTNEDLEKLVDTSHEWIMQRVGIRERHIVGENESTVTMAVNAAREALAAADLQPNDIGLIVVGTATNDFYFPSAACFIQKELGITNESPAFDLSAACAGFIYSLSVADQYVRSGAVKNALVVGVDALSQMVDWKDRNTCVLFGDGAGAVILQASNDPGILATHLHAAGQYADTLRCQNAMWHKNDPKYLSMEGSTVFKIAVSKLDEIVDQTLEKAKIQKSDIDWLIPHQANMRIIKATAKRLDLPMERVILTIEHHGNTSAASIPMALDYAARNRIIKRDETLMLEAFGGGLAWGSALVIY